MRLSAWFLSIVLLATVLGILHGQELWVRLICALAACVVYIVTWIICLVFRDERDDLRRKVGEGE